MLASLAVEVMDFPHQAINDELTSFLYAIDETHAEDPDLAGAAKRDAIY